MTPEEEVRITAKIVRDLVEKEGVHSVIQHLIWVIEEDNKFQNDKILQWYFRKLENILNERL
jgi:hypothetical protein